MPGSLKALRLENLLLSSQLTSAQLETELGDARKFGAWMALMQQRVPDNALLQSTTAVNVILGSATAMKAVVINDLATLALVNNGDPTALAGNAAAMAAITSYVDSVNAMAASTALMAAVAANTIARAAIYASDAALTAVANSANAIAALKASANYKTKQTSSGATSLSVGGNAILVAYYETNQSGDTGSTYTISSLRSGTTLSGTETGINRYATSAANAYTRVLPLTASSTITSSYASNESWYIGYILV